MRTPPAGLHESVRLLGPYSRKPAIIIACGNYRMVNIVCKFETLFLNTHGVPCDTQCAIISACDIRTVLPSLKNLITNRSWDRKEIFQKIKYALLWLCVRAARRYTRKSSSHGAAPATAIAASRAHAID